MNKIHLIILITIRNIAFLVGCYFTGLALGYLSMLIFSNMFNIVITLIFALLILCVVFAILEVQS